MTRRTLTRIVTPSLVLLAINGCGGRTNNGDYGVYQQPSGGEEFSGDAGGDPIGAVGGKGVGGYVSKGRGGYSSVTMGGGDSGGSTFYYSGGYGGMGGATWTSGSTGKGGTSQVSKGGTTGIGGATPTAGYKANGGTGIGGRTSGGAGGVSGIGAAAGKAYVAGATQKGGSAGQFGGAGGPPVLGGSAGTANCPKVTCSLVCPSGLWKGTDGCDDCLCAPPAKALVYDTLACATDALGVSATGRAAGSQLIFDFSWSCNATGSAMVQAIKASTQVILPINSTDPIGDPGMTVFQPSPAMSYVPIQFVGPQLTIVLTGAVSSPVVLYPTTSAFLSIRRQGDRVVGGINFVGTPNDATVTVTLAAPFDLVVPGA